MQLGEFFIALGFDVDEQKLKGFNDGIKTGMEGMLKMAAVAAGTVYAINKFVSGSVSAATALRNFNNETGQSIEGLQKWQIGATLTNASMTADQVTASFRKMSQSISDVTMGKGGGEFAMLNIQDVRGMSVTDVLSALGDELDSNISRYGYQQTIDLMSSIGFDKGMINALRLSGAELNNLADNRMMRSETIKRLVTLGDALSKVKRDLTVFKDKISAAWSPTIIKAISETTMALNKLGKNLRAILKAVNEFWSGLSGTNQEALVASAALIFAAFNPLTALFLSLAGAVYYLEEGLEALSNLTLGSALEAMIDKFGLTKGIAFDAVFNPQEKRADPQYGARIPAYATTNNITYNINSNASALEVAAEADKLYQSRQLNPASSDQNKGASF